MRRKRDFPGSQGAANAKRSRPLPFNPTPPEDQATAKTPPPSALVVSGIPSACSVLDLKSRFEIYGSISRIRIGQDGIGFVTYRAKESAEAAVAASHEPSFGISIDSKRLQVLWSTDPLAKWREGVTGEGRRESASFSKLVRRELPLSRSGRVGSRLASAVVKPRNEGNGVDLLSNPPVSHSREIVAYDDIL